MGSSSVTEDAGLWKAAQGNIALNKLFAWFWDRQTSVHGNKGRWGEKSKWGKWSSFPLNSWTQVQQCGFATRLLSSPPTYDEYFEIYRNKTEPREFSSDSCLNKICLKTSAARTSVPAGGAPFCSRPGEQQRGSASWAHTQHPCSAAPGLALPAEIAISGGLIVCFWRASAPATSWMNVALTTSCFWPFKKNCVFMLRNKMKTGCFC